MFKKIVLFGGGLLLGSYMMHTYLWKRIALIAINDNANENEENNETEEQ